MIVVLAATTALLLAGCGGEEPAVEADPASGPSLLEKAYEPCEELAAGVLAELDDSVAAEEVIRLEDGGASLIVSTPAPGGDVASGVALSVAACVLDETGAPATVEAKMGATSALSGPGSDSYGGVGVEWSYAAGTGAAGFNAFFRME